MIVTVVICTYNRSHMLRRALASLESLTASPREWEVVVVDNNSRDDTARVVAEFEARRLVPLRGVVEPVQGLSHARNAGIRAARGDVIAFMDDDAAAASEWLVALIECFETFGCLGVGGRILPLWDCPTPWWMARGGAYPLLAVLGEFDHGGEPKRLRIAPFGGNMAFRRAAFEKYGLFRVDLGRSSRGLMGCEDTEFGRRLLRAGETIMYAPRAVVYHLVESERLRKGYFLSWYFHYGRALVLLDPPVDGARHFGVPRQVLVVAIRGALKWFLSVNDQRRFYYKLEFVRALGEIVEFCRRTPSTGGSVRA